MLIRLLALTVSMMTTGCTNTEAVSATASICLDQSEHGLVVMATDGGDCCQAAGRVRPLAVLVSNRADGGSGCQGQRCEVLVVPNAEGMFIECTSPRWSMTQGARGTEVLVTLECGAPRLAVHGTAVRCAMEFLIP
ncbi:MAG TPA: hypothetical protein VK539_26125 [Myxococcaceae bacterium]|nr:hypothetical protein [Myxococcaceae bacterium]